MYNMKFIDPLNPIFYFQIINWMATMTTYYLMFYKEDSKIGDSVQLYIIFTVIILRVSTIAAKYSTFSRNQMRTVREVRLTMSDLEHELMFHFWAVQTDFQVLKELRCAVRRLNIDLTTFYIGFLDQDSLLGLESSLLSIYEKGKVFFDKKNLEYTYTKTQGKKKIKYYSGLVLLHFLIKKYNSKRNYYYMSMPFFIPCSILFGLSSGILRMYFGQPFFGEGILEILIFILNTVNIGFMTFVFLQFFLRFFIDINRKVYILEQLGQMLSPEVLTESSEDRVLPTIDIISAQSLHSWMNLRRVTGDYGLKYLKRHELFIPSILSILIVSSLILIDIWSLQNFIQTPSTSTNEPLSNQDISTLKLSFFCCFNSCFLFSLLIFLLYTASGVNSHYKSHTHIIKGNKVLLEDIKVYRDYYFSQIGTEYDDAIIAEGINDREYHEPQSILHHILVEDVASRMGDTGSVYQQAKIMDSVIDEQYDQLQEALGDDQIFNSFKLLGQEVTINSVNSFILFLISFGFTLYELLIK